MVIGNGDIASVLPDSEDKLFFASGVSNSGETRESEYKREMDLLKEQGKKRHLVYFSSLAALFTNTRYFQHKRDMEKLVKTFPRYTIIRLGNIAWGKNPRTLINSLKNQIKNGEEIRIRDEYRYICELDELLYWLNLIPKWNIEMNIPGKRMKVVEVLKEYVL